MRPSIVVLVKDQTDRVTSFYLFYNERKAIRAHFGFQDLSVDGSRTVVLEDGRAETIPLADGLRCQIRVVRAISPPLRGPKESFLGASREQLDGFAAAYHVPSEAIYEIAELERLYCENAAGARSEAFRRAYLPTFIGRWIRNKSINVNWPGPFPQRVYHIRPDTLVKSALAVGLLIAIVGWRYIDHHAACTANCPTDISAQRR
jgi:hypothetical protein